MEDHQITGKREKPEDIVLKLRQVEVLHGQGKSVQEAVRQICVMVQTFYRWRKLYGGMNQDQLKRLKGLETENQRQAITQMGAQIEVGSFLDGPRLLSIESSVLLKACCFH